MNDQNFRHNALTRVTWSFAIHTIGTELGDPVH